jgi:hypothetical protein
MRLLHEDTRSQISMLAEHLSGVMTIVSDLRDRAH